MTQSFETRCRAGWFMLAGMFIGPSRSFVLTWLLATGALCIADVAAWTIRNYSERTT